MYLKKSFICLSIFFISSEKLTKGQKLKVILQYAQELGKIDNLPTKTPSKFMLYSLEKIAELTKALKGEEASSNDCIAIMEEYFPGTFENNLASQCMVLK